MCLYSIPEANENVCPDCGPYVRTLPYIVLMIKTARITDQNKTRKIVSHIHPN